MRIKRPRMRETFVFLTIYLYLKFETLIVARIKKTSNLY